MTENKALVNWEEQMREEAKAVAKRERPSVNKISFKSGVMSYMDQAMPGNKMTGIILSGLYENVYYDTPYNANKISPPKCFALSLDGENMIPHEVVTEPQSPSCQECPHHKWGSDPKGGRGKACSERRRLAVIPAFEKVEDIQTSEMAVISLPVMSVKNWKTYVNTLSAKYQRPSWGVLTEISLVPDPKAQFKVTFADLAPIDSEFLPAIHSRLEVAVNTLLVPYDMTEEEEEPEEQKGKKKKF